ncbi:unnamed protein product, partial [Rotaria magnacalcarata]
EEVEEHLAPISGVAANSILDESDLAEDSCVEITSNFDENENELIKWTNYLQLSSNSDDDSDQDHSSTQSVKLVDYLSSESSSDNESISQSYQLGFTNSQNNINLILTYFEKNNNKRKTAEEIGCAPKQLRLWIQNKTELLQMSSRKKGNKRKRLDGGGKKLTYVDIDSRLFVWYREKRTDAASTTNVSDIRKERITFRQLERRGRQLSKELKHPCPSSKWFGRFLVRHRLSLQRPKRQQKIPLEEVHQKATSFYSFLRRASRWAPKRSAMGAFTPRDIFNMDESPLSLFGDQTKRSINDINTCNEVEGCLSNKRFCTVILTISAEDQRVDPVLLFKGLGHVSPAEEKQYAQGIKVYFTPKCVINKPTMDKYNEWFISKHYTDAAEECIEHNGPRSKIKLTASQSRILCTRLTSTAWQRTIKSVNFYEEFKHIGYTWMSNSPISPRTLPGYTFDPATIDLPLLQIDEDNDNEDRQIEIQAKLAEDNNKGIFTQKNTQTKLSHFWK